MGGSEKCQTQISQILIDFISHRVSGSEEARCGQYVILTDDVILKMEILEGCGASKGRSGDALQSVSIKTQFLKSILIRWDIYKQRSIFYN